MNNSAKLVMNAISATGMSLIPLFFEMKKYSVPTTNLSSIVIVAIVCLNNGGMTLSDIIFIPFTLASIGVPIAYTTVRKVERVNLYK